MRTPPRLEKAEQAAGVALLRTIGATVYVLGHARPQGDRPGTMQTPGLPDVEAFLPALAAAPALFLKWEAKRSRGGRRSPAQIEYGELCATAGVAYVVGDLDALIAFLIGCGRLRADQVPHDRLPPARRLEEAGV
jgi:hypothetical protein